MSIGDSGSDGIEQGFCAFYDARDIALELVRAWLLIGNIHESFYMPLIFPVGCERHVMASIDDMGDGGNGCYSCCSFKTQLRNAMMVKNYKKKNY